MAELAPTPRLAVLIDADNASPKIAEALFAEIAKIGEASVRRIYGDFSKQHLDGWKALLSPLALMPLQNFAYVAGKNATDIALVIDAMDLLHSRRFDAFCLVSSDSDFTRLAMRLREEGVDVYGFGEQKTPESFRKACKRFIYTENLGAEAALGGGLRPALEAVKIIERAMDGVDDHDGWFRLSVVGSNIAKLESDFDPRTYGAAKLSTLAAKTGQFETRLENNHHLIRRKPVAA